MITIRVFEDKKGNIRGLNVSGHAGFSKKGEDIVCAGVSALTYTLLNSMELLLGIYAKPEVKEGYVNFKLPYDIENDKFEKSQLILKTIILGFENMHDSYESFIELVKEV